MIMDKLNTDLRDHAVSYGLCQQWQNDWQDNKNQQELIDMYIRGIDFCIEHGYPTVDYIKNNFDRSLLHENHIFVDERVDGGDNGIYVISGKCSGKLSFDRFTVATVHLRHDSELTIEVGDCANVFVSVYDRAKVHVKQNGVAKVYVYVYNGNCEVEAEGDVMVRYKMNMDLNKMGRL